MRFCTKKTWLALLAMAVLGAVQAACAQDEEQPRAGRNGKAAPAKGQADDDQRAKLLTMKDFLRMRHNKMSPDDIVEKAKQQGVAFEVTPPIERQLRRMGFKPEQIEAIKDSYGPRPKEEKTGGEEKPAPIEPGKGLRTTDAQRDRTREVVEKICKLSGAELSPVETAHFTLWAAKDVQRTYLPDIKKLEQLLETRFPEPIRSGLDKRAAHIVLIKRRYEYEKWIRAMYDVCKSQFEQHGPQALTIQQQVAFALKSKGFYCSPWVVYCLEDGPADQVHRHVGAAVGFLYQSQLGNYSHTDPLCTGFANVAESVIAGWPSIMIAGQSYGNENRDLGNDGRGWIHLVQQRIITKQVTPVAALLKMDATRMFQPHYAEAWALATFLAKQPAKFAKLVEELAVNKDTLEVIKDVYGWDEKELTAQWHKYVLAQR